MRDEITVIREVRKKVAGRILACVAIIAFVWVDNIETPTWHAICYTSTIIFGAFILKYLFSLLFPRRMTISADGLMVDCRWRKISLRWADVYATVCDEGFFSAKLNSPYARSVLLYYDGGAKSLRLNNWSVDPPTLKALLDKAKTSASVR